MRRVRHVVAFTLIGCASTEHADSTAAPDRGADASLDARPRRAAKDDLLAFVPDDTPYVIASLEPAPRDYLRRIERVVAPMRDAMQRAIDRVDESSLDPELAALVRELDGRISAEGLRELGFDPDARFVLYGVGLAPVLRLRLHDAGRVHALLRRIDAADGEAWPRARVSGREVWRIAEDESAVAWAIVGDDLVAAAYPTALEDEVLSVALGVHAPARSLADTGFARAMKREHGLLPQGLGRIDIAAIVDAWAGRGSSLATKTARAWDVAIDDTACVEAVRVAVARAPEVAFGFTELSDAAVRGRWVWRMDGRLRADLQDIAGPIAQTSDGVAEAAFAFDMSRAYAAARRFAADIDRAAPGCIGTEVASAWTLPEAIAAVKSGAATLHAYDPRDTSLGYTVAIGLSDAERWINAVWPEIDLKDWPRRRAVAVDKLWPSSRAWIDDAFVARTKDTVAVAGGDRARVHARRAARASGRDDDTLASLHLGLGLLRKAIPPRELRQALDELDPIERAFAEGLLDLLGDYDARLYADDAGLAAEWSLRLR